MKVEQAVQDMLPEMPRVRAEQRLANFMHHLIVQLTSVSARNTRAHLVSSFGAAEHATGFCRPPLSLPPPYRPRERCLAGSLDDSLSGSQALTLFKSVAPGKFFLLRP